MALNALTATYTDSEGEEDNEADEEEQVTTAANQVRTYSQPTSRQSTPASVYGGRSGTVTPVKKGAAKAPSLVPYNDEVNIAEEDHIPEDMDISHSDEEFEEEGTADAEGDAEEGAEVSEMELREQEEFGDSRSMGLSERKRAHLEATAEMLEAYDGDNSQSSIREEAVAAGVVMPPEPPGQCPREVEESFAVMFERKKKVMERMGRTGAGKKLDANKFIMDRKDFRNPSLYEKLIELCDLEEFGTNFPPELYNPHMWGQQSYYDELAKAQKSVMDKLEKDRKERTKVEVVSGTAKKPSSSSGTASSTGTSAAGASIPAGGDEKKRSKWDQVGTGMGSGVLPPTLLTTNVSGTKATVIPAFGVMKKK